MKWISILIVALLAGCLSDDTQEGEDPDLSAPGEEHGEEHGEEQGEGEGTHNESADLPELIFTASSTEGQAPFNVTFDIDVTPRENGTYVLNFGDGESVEGDVVPANHTYAYGAGNHTATVVFSTEAGSVNATINITVAEVTVTVDDDGLCHAPDAQSVGGAAYVHHRGGDSIWIYEESNGVPGLQLSPDPFVHGGTDPLGAGCVNGDTGVF